MKMLSLKKIKQSTALVIIAITISQFFTACTSTKQTMGSTPITIQQQGSFSAGGTVKKSEGTFDALKPWHEQQGGQTRHGDHADVFYQIPVNSKRNAMVFLHGYGQSRRSWQTTADGRQGFAEYFFTEWLWCLSC